MASATDIKTTHKALSKASNSIYFAPIRHHSPACAWALRELIREVKPAQILIEAPKDFECHIENLLHVETVPPIAVAAIVEKDKKARLAAYYPFCTHSPEFVALREGRNIGAELSFIDLPSNDKAMLGDNEDNRTVNLQSEKAFDSGDYIAALCKTLGCRDGYELWDHLFETRLGTSDWRSFFADVGAYCAGMRAATSHEELERTGDIQREDFMASCLKDASSKDGNIVVVVGGFHVPALIKPASTRKVRKAKSTTSSKNSYLIRYGYAAMDALNGYGAGLPQPGYYDYLWQQAEAVGGAPDWRQTAVNVASDFTGYMRRKGEFISLPAQVEMIRTAEQLAVLRGRPGALRHDLIDGARTALIKGEAARRDIWTERLLGYLRGTKLGDVPASAGSPPLVEDARNLAKTMRMDVSDSARRHRKLDIRRKPAHLKVSQYFHAMKLLGTGFAEKQIGPDYLNDARTELLFEEWSYAWSPAVEGTLTEHSIYGDQLQTACVNFIKAQRDEMIAGGQGRDVGAMVTLFARGLLAGLGQNLTLFLKYIESDIHSFGDFTTTANALQRLTILKLSEGPLGIPEEMNIDEVLQGAYARLLYLCDDIAKTPNDMIDSRISALKLIVELLRGDGSGIFDKDLFENAIDRVADSQPPAKVFGAILAICVQGGTRQTSELATALSGQFTGSVTSSEDRIDVLCGVLQTVPSLLWREPDILAHIDDFICDLDETDFLTLLPHLRHAFTDLNPRETDRLAELLGQKYDQRMTDFVPTTSNFTEAEMQRHLVIDKKLRQSLENDQLASWVMEGASNV